VHCASLLALCGDEGGQGCHLNSVIARLGALLVEQLFEPALLGQQLRVFLLEPVVLRARMVLHVLERLQLRRHDSQAILNLGHLLDGFVAP
jgi:hypothetical protein